MIQKTAFYAPMKAPTHTVPSGDRRMARLLWQLLQAAGYNPFLASEFRSFDKTGDINNQTQLQEQGLSIADQIIFEWANLPAVERPDAWFTYHLYHKAPDWLGPKVCEYFGIPYIVAEASHATKQKNGPWHMGYEATEKAIFQADQIFYMTAFDGTWLRRLRKGDEGMTFLPPFLDSQYGSNLDFQLKAQALEIFKAAGGNFSRKKLLSVGMMRSGDKMDSYSYLARALSYLEENSDWQLIIVGDGDEATEIKSFFSEFDGDIVFVGEQPADLMPAFYDLADLYVWPASGEAYGMAFLEAQKCGLPVVAGNTHGVPDVVKDGLTGHLVPLNDPKEFASAINRLLDTPKTMTEMSKAATKFVEQERGFKAACDLLEKAAREISR